MTQATLLPDPAVRDLRVIRFTVYGTPQQVGSKTPWIPRRKDGSMIEKNGRPVIATMDSNKKSKPWMAAVREAAGAAVKSDFELLDGPVRVEVEFRFSRPKSHYRTGKHSAELRPDAPTWHTQTPDLDKLQRCLGDALTSVLLRDDSLIAIWHDPRKVWTSGQAGAFVIVEEIDAKGGE